MTDIGCAVAAQSANLVPADGKLYALRDATATVPSVPLIAASVMSKKLAVQTDLILLDVKAGSGAFMKTPEEAEVLARACLSLARGWGRARRRRRDGHVAAARRRRWERARHRRRRCELLRGTFRGRLRDLAVIFAARALEATEHVPHNEAVARAERALDGGEALERFRSMVAAQGGDPRVVDDPEGVLPRAPVVLPIEARTDGTLAAVDAGGDRIGERRVGRGADPQG